MFHFESILRCPVGKIDTAIQTLADMVKADLTESSVWNTPASLLRDLSTDFHFPKKKNSESTRKKLAEFENLASHPAYVDLLQQVDK